MGSLGVSNAVSSDNLEIPLISFNDFLSGDESTRHTTAKAILSGFQNAGFIYLKDHPIPKSVVQKTFEESARFWKRPLEQKEKMAWSSPEANRGWTRQGREKTSNSFDFDEIAKQRELEGADLKESFEIGREGEEGHPNHWPDQFDEEGKQFKAHMIDFFERCKQMHMQVMRAIAIGIGLEETWFDGFTDGGDNTLRLLHYPAVSAEVFKNNKNTVRAGAHSDYGSITLVRRLSRSSNCHASNIRQLFQDARGGLQVMSPNGNFIDATPIEDTIVVNAGDLLARWANDTIKSTKHRVVEPPTPADVHPTRYSRCRVPQSVGKYVLDNVAAAWMPRGVGFNETLVSWNMC
jgi:isopenicillin N synthase-like dioxygenase